MSVTVFKTTLNKERSKSLGDEKASHALFFLAFLEAGNIWIQFGGITHLNYQKKIPKHFTIEYTSI